MATIADPREELAGLRSQLEKVQSEKRARAMAAASRAPGLNGDLDRLQREESRLIAQIEAVERFAGSEAAANLDAAIAERHRQREIDRQRVIELQSARIGHAKRIDAHRLALAGELAALDDATAEMRALWNGHVEAPTDNRRAEYYSGILSTLSVRAMADWKEAAGKVIGLLRGEATASDRMMAARDLGDLLADHEAQMLERMKREFPSRDES